MRKEASIVKGIIVWLMMFCSVAAVAGAPIEKRKADEPSKNPNITNFHLGNAFISSVMSFVK